MKRRRGKQKLMMRWARDLLCGALIGIAAILPGVSGGVLAVVFDIYRPFMEFLTHPKAALSRYWRWIPPIAIGWCVGFLGFARGLSMALDASGTITTWLFIGLIVGTLPQLFQEAGKEGRTTGAWMSFFLCTLAVFAGLYHLTYVAKIVVRPNIWWYNFCGVLWGMGVVIPGMTSSSVMMALGLYEPMLDGLASLDLPVLIGALPGMLLTMLLLARVVNWLFKTHYALVSHGILGIVLASTLVILPTGYEGAGEILLSGCCCIGGFLLAYAMARLDQKLAGTAS